VIAGHSFRAKMIPSNHDDRSSRSSPSSLFVAGIRSEATDWQNRGTEWSKLMKFPTSL